MRRERFRILICFVVLILISVGAARAQDGERPTHSLSIAIDTADRAELIRADEFLADGQINEAVETIRRLLEDEGEKLMQVAANAWCDRRGYVCYVPTRELCHLRLARAHRLAPEALASYRRRVDPLALDWFKKGTQQHGERWLERLVVQNFTSKYGDNALFHLGEVALERGETARARGYWERISPVLRAPSVSHEAFEEFNGWPLWLALHGLDLDAHWDELKPLITQFQGKHSWLAYPDTDLELADVRARLVLVSILEGAADRAAVELDVFRRIHPDAKGKIGGQSGSYVSLLSKLLDASRSWPRVEQENGWPTFGGAVTRNRATIHEIDIGQRPIWQLGLLPVAVERELIGLGRPRVAEDGRGALSYHPLIVGDLVLWNTSRRILAHRLHDKKPVWESVGSESGEDEWQCEIYPNAGGSRDDRETLAFKPDRGHVGVPRFTVTRHENKVFARLGGSETGSRDSKEDRQKSRRSFLVGIDLSKQGKLLPEFPILPDKDVRWEFEGTPISDGSRIYVAMRYTTQEGAMPEMHIACFALPTIESPRRNAEDRRRPLWRVKICTAETPAGSLYDEVTHSLLTMNEGTIYCNTNMGAVAAIEPENGRLKWLVRYPRSPLRPADPDRIDLHYFRDLNPCLCYRDLVIVAPTDSDRIFAIDAVTGRPRWENKNAEAIHLLGVGAGNLIASGVYLYWIDVETGNSVGQFPGTRGGLTKGMARPEPRSYGRGLLAGDHVYWPTREQILVFKQQIKRSELGPRPIREPIQFADMKISTGNLVMADGVLLIASANRMYAFRNSIGKSKDAER